MASSGQINTGGYGGRYFEFNWSLDSRDTNSGTGTVNWNLIARSGGATWYYTKNVRVIINGVERFNAGGGKTKCYRDSVFASGSLTVNGGSNFSVEIHGDIYTYGTDNAAAGGNWTIDNIKPPVVNPTLPNSVVCSGGTDNNWWLDKDSATFNVSWSGATRGTYTINQYSIDVSKNNWGSSVNAALAGGNNTSGSKNNVPLSGLSLKGGETVKVRVGMQTTDGTWWGHTYWGGSFHIYSKPSAPTTFNVPSSQEIDTAFNINWSGAKAGSEGIYQYQIERRVYNGSSWGGWTRISNTGSTSISQGTPKSITNSSSDSCQIQYRVRVFDGHYGYSDWNTKTLSVKINLPSTPRKQKCFHK